MKKITVLLLLLIIVQNIICQDSYWSCRGEKNYNETFKTAFVTTKDQNYQFIIKHMSDRSVEILLITSDNLYEESRIRFRFDDSPEIISGNLDQIGEGVFKCVPFEPESDGYFNKSSDLSRLTIGEFINYLKKYNRFVIYVNTFNQYAQKNFTYNFTLKNSSINLNWVMSPEFNWWQ